MNRVDLSTTFNQIYNFHRLEFRLDFLEEKVLSIKSSFPHQIQFSPLNPVLSMKSSFVHYIQLCPLHPVLYITSSFVQ